MNLRVRHGLWLLKYKTRGAPYVQREQAVRLYLDRISEGQAVGVQVQPSKLAKTIAQGVSAAEKEPGKWDFTKLVLFLFGLAVLPLVVVLGLIALCLVILLVFSVLLLAILLTIFLLLSVVVTALGIFSFGVSLFVWHDWASALFFLGAGLALLCGGILLCMLTLSVAQQLFLGLRNRIVRRKRGEAA